MEIALRVGEEGPRVRVYARNPGPRPLVGRQTGNGGQDDGWVLDLEDSVIDRRVVVLGLAHLPLVRTRYIELIERRGWSAGWTGRASLLQPCL